ncbi:hypothetical protein WAK64_15320 [Bacillus spongiae]|uniref:Uncharacterized protein n=1 Tax=Bacillus spongiae TaxID=2683610 RepID=A0ABU8HH18_9BACI
MNYKRIFSDGFIENGRKDVIMWEAQPISNCQEIKITFIEITLHTDKGFG